MTKRRLWNDYPAFVISLARTPERLRRFREWNRPAEIDIETFNAIDGRDLVINEVDPAILQPGTTTYAKGAIGSALSHRSLWERCAEVDKPFLIFEDDAAIRSDARTVLPSLVNFLGTEWDVLLLGYNTTPFTDFAISDGIVTRATTVSPPPGASQLVRFTTGRMPVGLARVRLFFGLCGYLLSPAGARGLLAGCFPLDERQLQDHTKNNRPLRTYTLDTRVSTHLHFLRAYACVPPLVMPDNSGSVK